jgi:glucan phosphoethanolaminetransferase (alkaline phosphatase superfamily)
LNLATVSGKPKTSSSLPALFSAEPEEEVAVRMKKKR